MELRETQRAVAPFGGLVVFFEFLRGIGYCEAVRKHLPFCLRSPKAIDPVKTFTAFFGPFKNLKGSIVPGILADQLQNIVSPFKRSGGHK